MTILIFRSGRCGDKTFLLVGELLVIVRAVYFLEVLVYPIFSSRLGDEEKENRRNDYPRGPQKVQYNTTAV